MLVGKNGLTTRTRESKFKTELSELKEEFKLSKMIENKDFQESSLTSDVGVLKYNTKKQDEQEIKWLQDLGIEKNPYDIEKGELKSSYENLKLLDENGTIVVPASVTKIGDRAFHNKYNLQKITIPEGVTEIGASFNYCTTLKEIEILIVHGIQ